MTTRMVLVVLIVASSACTQSTDPRQEVVVSAAASLTDVFGAIEIRFEEGHLDLDVLLNFGASSALREQILEGAAVDVFAPANLANMEAIVQAGEAAQSEVFATNRLQIAVPEGNPAEIVGLEDFARDELFVGLCAEGVPCGRFARQALASAGVAAAIDTNETDVRALLTKVEAGEVDAGIVYATDVLASDGVDGVDIAVESNVVVEYPIARLVHAPNPDGAEQFMAFVLSDEGQAVLDQFGFGSP